MFNSPNHPTERSQPARSMTIARRARIVMATGVFSVVAALLLGPGAIAASAADDTGQADPQGDFCLQIIETISAVRQAAVEAGARRNWAQMIELGAIADGLRKVAIEAGCEIVPADAPGGTLTSTQPTAQTAPESPSSSFTTPTVGQSEQAALTTSEHRSPGDNDGQVVSAGNNSWLTTSTSYFPSRGNR